MKLSQKLALTSLLFRSLSLCARKRFTRPSRCPPWTWVEWSVSTCLAWSATSGAAKRPSSFASPYNCWAACWPHWPVTFGCGPPVASWSVWPFRPPTRFPSSSVRFFFKKIWVKNDRVVRSLDASTKKKIFSPSHHPLALKVALGLKKTVPSKANNFFKIAEDRPYGISTLSM